MSTYWTCQRQRNGRKCGKKNPGRKQLCEACGGRRRKKPRAKHLVALEAPYETYITLNGGEHCAICLRRRGAKKLHRDHDHRRGTPRGLLCFRCNARLDYGMTPEWLEAAAAYLRSAA